MPNTFAPRAFERVVKQRVDTLRLEYDGPSEHVKEWHAMVDMLDDDSTQEFRDRFGRVETVPPVVSGFEDNATDESEG